MKYAPIPFFRVVRVCDPTASQNVRALRARIRVAPATPSPSSEDRALSLVDRLLEAVTLSEGDAESTPPHPDAFIHALDVLELLPTHVPLPELSVDRDGDIALDWDEGPRSVFSVRISRDGTAYHAGLFGYEPLHGAPQSSAAIRRAISHGLSRLYAWTQY